MSSQKISDADKNLIVELYRESKETTLTLADRFGISSSTIRRIIKSALSDAEYETLVQQKQRRTGDGFGDDPLFIDNDDNDPNLEDEESMSKVNFMESEITEELASSVPNRRLRKRRPSLASEVEPGPTDQEYQQLELGIGGFLPAEPEELLVVDYNAQVNSLQAMLGEELLDGEEEDFDEDDDFDEESDEESDGLSPLSYGFIGNRSGRVVQTLPLQQAVLPKICYLVVDRGSDLVTRPLKAFAELGEIPEEDIREKTLPVFDNHRVAKRFAARNQRIFKVPDGQLLQKTAPYLKAKGITRLLIDGQVYTF